MSAMFSNPEWWTTLILGGVVSSIIPKAYKTLQNIAALLVIGTKGRLQTFMRRQKRNRLIKIKSKRFDSVAINREIALSYALFVIFAIASIATIAAIAKLPSNPERSEAATVFVGFCLAGPAFLFEIAWLNASTRVDNLIKYRKRIKRSRQQLC